MMTFRNRRLRDHTLPMSTAWLLNDIAEARGRQDLFALQSPQVLKALRDAAIIQSAESSNRIEGVTVDPERLRPLVLGDAKPRDRSEQEVQGYRRALTPKAFGVERDSHAPGTTAYYCRHAQTSARALPVREW